MSSDRNRLSKPARPPLTPRVAGSATSAPLLRPSAPRLPTGSGSAVGPGTPIASPRIASRPTDDTHKGVAPGTFNANITPRSAKRKSRVDSSTNSPLQDESPADTRPKSTGTSTLGLPDSAYGRTNGGTGLGVSIGYGQNKAQGRLSRPKSLVGAGSSPPPVRSPGYADLSTQQDSIESRFFHASDARRQESVAKKPEVKRAPAFFYADGKEDTPCALPKSLSPVMSAMNERGSSTAGQRPESQINLSKSISMASPALSATGSIVSSFFPSQSQPMRAPSPSKENIHLSYRKGASQIFGTRRTPRQPLRPADLRLLEESRRPSIGAPHHKSPSLSSIDSGNSHASRRRSATAVEAQSPTSSLPNAPMVTVPVPRLGSPPANLPTIDTSLASSISPVVDNGSLSPTKHVSELAADARRERKVLDLEISNSSLLAINASLEREVRRQKMELKRFRRLSRAGRFSIAASEITHAKSSGGTLGTFGEDDEEEDNPFEAAMMSGLVDLDDGFSDSEEDDSLMSSNDPLSPDAQQNRLAKDEKRLRVDLEKHKELLVVSQNINQSLKRCMYATEAMIEDGRKALQYHVRVSDVKLGGRILSSLDGDDEEIEIEDELDAVAAREKGDGDVDGMKGLLDVWSAVGRAQLDGSEGSGDRDSGIELENKLYSGRPPETPAAAPAIGNIAAAAAATPHKPSPLHTAAV